MPVEPNASRIGNLNPQWPRDNEIIAEGAAHIRGIKQALRSENNALINSIILWWGTVNNIPPGYVICNGQNGTPDMRDRFPVGAGGKYNRNATGGSDNVELTVGQLPEHKHTLEEAGSHNHSGKTANAGTHIHGATTSQSGSHSHSASVSDHNGHSHAANSENAGTHSHTGGTNTAGGHNHSGTAQTAGNHAHTIFMGGGSSGPQQRISVDTGGQGNQYIGSNNSTEGAGAHSHNLQIAGAGEHTHTVAISNAGNHNHPVNVGTGGQHTHSISILNAGNHTHNMTIGENGNHNHNINTDGGHTHTVNNTGSGQSHENRPPYRALFFIMRIDI